MRKVRKNNLYLHSVLIISTYLIILRGGYCLFSNRLLQHSEPAWQRAGWHSIMSTRLRQLLSAPQGSSSVGLQSQTGGSVCPLLAPGPFVYCKIIFTIFQLGADCHQQLHRLEHQKQGMNNQASQEGGQVPRTSTLPWEPLVSL